MEVREGVAHITDGGQRHDITDVPLAVRQMLEDIGACAGGVVQLPQEFRRKAGQGVDDADRLQRGHIGRNGHQHVPLHGSLDELMMLDGEVVHHG